MNKYCYTRKTGEKIKDLSFDEAMREFYNENPVEKEKMDKWLDKIYSFPVKNS